MTAMRKIRESLGLTQAEAARRLGLSRQAYSNYELGKRQADYEMLLKISEDFRCSVEELLGRKPEPTNIGAVFGDHFRMVPVYESVSAGFGATAIDYITEYAPFRIVSDTEALETIAIRVTGDSMFPKIEDGDIIQVHRQDSVDSGDIAVLLIDGEEGVVKRMQFGEDYVDLISINPNYPPRRFKGKDMERLQVVGLVKGVFHEF